MYMQEDQFAQAMKTLSLILGVPEPNKKKIDFYFRLLKEADYFDLKSAFEFFGEQGKWPTVRELLNECGMKGRVSRAEREKAKRAFEEADKSGYELPDAREIYGEFTIESIAESEDETAAKKELDAKTEGLKSIGWNVSSFVDYKCRKDVVDGRFNRERILWKRHHRAFRFRDPNPDHDPRFTQLLRLMEAAVHAAAAQ